MTVTPLSLRLKGASRAEKLKLKKLIANCEWIIKHGRIIENHWHDENFARHNLDKMRLFNDGAEGSTICPEWTLFQRLIRDIKYEQGLRHFIAVLVPIERLLTNKISDLDLYENFCDSPYKKGPEIPLYLILDNIRSSFNVGSILRTAECLGIKSLYLTGYTPLPHPGHLKTAMGAEQFLVWQHRHHVIEAIHEIKDQGVPLFAAETSSQSISLYETSFPKPMALLLGNERYGVSEKTLQEVDAIVRIPMFGVKNSLNVSVAMGMIGSEIRRQWTTNPSGETSL